MLHSEHEIVCLSELDRKRHVYSTRIQHAKLTDDPHITSFAEVRDLLTFLHTEGHKTGRYTLGLLQCLGISGRFPYIRIEILLP